MKVKTLHSEKAVQNCCGMNIQNKWENLDGHWTPAWKYKRKKEEREGRKKIKECSARSSKVLA
jgi:hypothetical protein